jgi:DNA topoisomerase 2-associated protein PAT1
MSQVSLEERLLWQQQEAQALAAEHQHRSFNTPSPARHLQQQARGLPASLVHEGPSSSQQNHQLQQRLLTEMEFAQIPGQSRGSASQEQLRAEAMRRIMETEREEEKRRRKAHKIASMVSGLVQPSHVTLVHTAPCRLAITIL